MKFKRQQDNQGKQESGADTEHLTLKDIPLMMTFTPSSPCDPAGGPPIPPPAANPFAPAQLHPYSTPSSTTPAAPQRAHNTNNNKASNNYHDISNLSSNTYRSPNSSPPLPPPTATTIEMDRILKQDAAIEKEFTPPRQAMGSDESDFDWDEDINIDDDGRKKTDKQRSKWRKLSPCLRMTILMLIVAPIVAIPAIMTRFFYHIQPKPANEDDTVAMDFYIHQKVRKDAVVLFFTWLATMWCVVCVTNWGVDVIPMFIVRLTSLVASNRLETIKSRLLIFVATKKYFKWLCASCWAIGSFSVLSNIIHPIIAQQPWQPVIILILACIIVGCALLLIEKILLQIISKNFHQTAYADRIKANKYALQVLDRLGTSKKVHRKVRPTHSRNNTAENGDYISPFGAGYRSRQQSRSPSFDSDRVHLTEPGSNTSTPLCTPTEHNNSRMSTLVNPPRKAQRDSKGKSSDLFKGINRTLQGIAMADSVPTKDINSTANAKRVAKSLFHNLQGHGDELVVEDFFPYFDTEAEAKEAFAIFDKDGNGDISKREMKEKIFYIYKERKDLHTSLRDLSQAVGKLDIIFLTLFAVVWIMSILLIANANLIKNMVPFGSALIAISFVFGNSLKTLFENIVFLFITHPYDSGDLVSIDNIDMYVREVGLNSTIFVTWDGKRMYFPNHILSQKPIHNVRRSPNMSEKIVLNIDCYTPECKILELRARMRDFLLRESKEFLPDMEIQIQEMDVKLKISMVIEHKGNWQDSGRRWARRTKFNFALKEAVEDIGIRYYALPQRMEIVHREQLEQEQAKAEEEFLLSPKSPSRNLNAEKSRIYRRKTNMRPQGG
ncbi:hypothetical protein BGZ72_008750 [Mortierella alpina]|nr:hypothetical protein BGZ72_008750 [Mortierella alpina]